MEEKNASKSDPTCLVECETKELTADAAPSLGRPNVVPGVSAVEEEHRDQLVAQAAACDNPVVSEKPEPGHAYPILGEIFSGFESLDRREKGVRVFPGQDEVGLPRIGELPGVFREVSGVLPSGAGKAEVEWHGSRRPLCRLRRQAPWLIV